MPKLMKAKKDKTPKIKKKKVKKQKTKRPKKALKLKLPKLPKITLPKLPKPKLKNPLSKKKKILLIVVSVLILIILGAVTAILIFTLGKKGEKEEAPPEAPAYYFSKDEELSSITTVVGEREFINLTVIPEESEEAKETEAAKEDKKEKSGKKKGSEETSKEENADAESSSQESAGTEESQDAAEETTAGETPVPEEVYKYLHVEDVKGDIKSYQTYLETEKNFLDVTEKNEPEEKPDTEDPQEGHEFYTFAGPSKDSESHLVITLETDGDSYTVTARKEAEPWNTYFRILWNQQKSKIEDFEKKPKATTSIEQAEDTVRSQSQEKLGLPEPTESYEFIAAPGLSKVDGTNYYTVRTYKRQEDGALYYMGTYLFNYDTNQVGFSMDEITGETKPLE